jgi:hypothetical protein
LVLMMLAGCGGSKGAYAPHAPANAKSGGYGPTTQSTSDYGGYAGDAPSAPPPPATAAPGGGARAEAPAPAPEQRPGLGTEWGETRDSRVHDVAFFRDSDRPFAIAAMHYNDRAGVDALIRYHGVTGSAFREYSARGGAITISIRNQYGQPLEAFRVGDRTYVVGSAGDRYSIVMQNHTAHRFEAVATVDGLDVINGRTGDLSNRGYVLMPYATLEIDGFRQSQSTVAAFRFGRVGDSYAAQTGDARNVGVIGVAFFAERGDTYSDDELRTRDNASPFPGTDPRFARPPR